jgi:predicted phage baseplate assembly protein
MQCQPDAVTYDPSLALVLLTPRRALGCAPGSATAAVNLRVDFTVESASWQPVPHLLDSPPFARHFVVDVDGEGRAELRLGDGDYGRSGATAIGFAVTYRVGNGRAGNVGAESLAHVIRPPAPPAWPDILALRNPLPARDGSDAETIEQVRQYAPAAFRAEQFRAVTEEDWARAACKMPGVAGAVAAFRWTGSWYTVYVGIDASDPEQVITDPGGRTRLTPGFAGDVRRWLTRYKLAGYDLEIRAAEYVPLAIDLDVCVSPDHFRGDVAAAVRQALSNRVNADGSIGFFHPGRWSFGQPVYVSQLYAAVERVPGVDSVVVTRFEQFGRDANGELAAGVIELGPWEIARLDNDPNFMERGLLRIHAMDGK